MKREVVSDEMKSDNDHVVVDSADADISRTDHVVVERIGVRTGNFMIDQYEPYYWGCAFVFFLFSRIIVGILTCQHLLIRPGLDDLQMRLV